MKKVLIASILAVSTGSAFAVTPSFNDHPEHAAATAQAAQGVAGRAASTIGSTNWALPMGANY